jgi:hypothetical protein
MVVQYTSGVSKSGEAAPVLFQDGLSRMYNDGTSSGGPVRMAFEVHGLTSKWPDGGGERKMIQRRFGMTQVRRSSSCVL